MNHNCLLFQGMCFLCGEHYFKGHYILAVNFNHFDAIFKQHYLMKCDFADNII